MKGSALEKFAQEARLQLQKEVKVKLEQIKNGDESVDLLENKKAIDTLNKILETKSEESLIKEVAYTWFNRISALRFMDARGYNSTMIVSPVEGKTLPEILSDALSGVIDDDILTEAQKDRIHCLLDGSISSKNMQADIYRILLVASCNALNDSLPMLFEKINDYTDLLLPDDLLSSESVVTKTVNALTTEDCENSVEIIGWIYQYYISEKKDEVFASFKKGKKAGSEEIPAATQLFTPEWIVRYLVENSLGRLWMLNHPESSLKDKMKYYIAPAEPEKDFIHLSSPEEIKILDPCCGSGHMLTYAFDLLFDIYTECGYSDNDATENIITKNLYGIEIDRRAGQLAYFALMMKARERSRRFFRKHLFPNICILENVTFDKEELPKTLNLFTNSPLNLMELMQQFEHADILGSLITPVLSDIRSLKESLTSQTSEDMFSEENTLLKRVRTVLEMAEYLSDKYQVVVTNPPYMGNSHMETILKSFLEKEYKAGKSDLMTAFMIFAQSHTPQNGYWAIINLPSWMFISSFEDLRKEIVHNQQICSLLHLGRGIFGSDFGTVAFVCKNQLPSFDGIYRRLFEHHVEVRSIATIETLFFDTTYNRFMVAQNQFEKIPGCPIVYWASKTIYDLFTNNFPLGHYVQIKQGIKTGDNERFIRLWPEVSITKFSKFNGNKWFPDNSGGKYRRWYGNFEYVINWENNGAEICNFFDEKGKLRSRPQNLKFQLKKGLTYSSVSSGNFGIRFCPEGSIFDSSGSMIFCSESILFYILSYLGSIVVRNFQTFLSPSIGFEVGQLQLIPLKEITNHKKINILTTACIDFSKSDWDSFETSWDFSVPPMLYEKIQKSEGFDFEDDEELKEYLGDEEYARIFHSDIDGSRTAWSPVEFAYLKYKDRANKAFFHLKKNEEELNRIFIDIYGLQDELKPEEDVSMVSVHRIFDDKSEIPESMKDSQYALTKEKVIKSLISFAVGCMFGRYSPFASGLQYAGGEWDNSKFDSRFMPDEDNVIPMLDDSWFENDAERYFIRFLEVVFGKDSLNENLKFVENALGMSVRKYFAKYFYQDHCKTYQKRPIYWMFSSPKGYFNVLVYMHRYNENTANIVLRYLREFRDKIQDQIKRAHEANETRKELEYQNMDKDLNDYEINILYSLASDHVTFDLDDGVKVNYQKLGKALKAIK